MLGHVMSIPGEFLKDRIDEYHRRNPISPSTTTLLHTINNQHTYHAPEGPTSESIIKAAYNYCCQECYRISGVCTSGVQVSTPRCQVSVTEGGPCVTWYIWLWPEFRCDCQYGGCLVSILWHLVVEWCYTWLWPCFWCDSEYGGCLVSKWVYLGYSDVIYDSDQICKLCSDIGLFGDPVTGALVHGLGFSVRQVNVGVRVRQP